MVHTGELAKKKKPWGGDGTYFEDLQIERKKCLKTSGGKYVAKGDWKISLRVQA